MKTPEEIKKGLECCQTIVRCSICPYHDIGDIVAECTAQLCGDALEHIQQLESRLAQAERERDAAVEDLTNSSPCFACYHFIRNKGACKGGMRCCDEQFKAEIENSDYDGPKWQWRGVCPENAKESNDA